MFYLFGIGDVPMWPVQFREDIMRLAGKVLVKRSIVECFAFIRSQAAHVVSI
jgi:hypothetical protein